MNTFGGSNCLGVWCLLPFLFFFWPRGPRGVVLGAVIHIIWLKISYFAIKYDFFLVTLKLEAYTNYWLDGMLLSTTYCFLVGITVVVGHIFG